MLIFCYTFSVGRSRCPKSEVWKYFVRADKDGATCNICFKFVKGSTNTSNYHKHLEANHNLSLRKPKNPAIVETQTTGLTNVLRGNSSDSSQSGGVSDSASSTAGVSTSCSSAKGSIQPKLRSIIEAQLSFNGKNSMSFSRI